MNLKLVDRPVYSSKSDSVLKPYWNFGDIWFSCLIANMENKDIFETKFLTQIKGNQVIQVANKILFSFPSLFFPTRIRDNSMFHGKWLRF